MHVHRALVGISLLLALAAGCSSAGAEGSLVVDGGAPPDDAATTTAPADTANTGDDALTPADAVTPVDAAPAGSWPRLAVGTITGATADELGMIADGVTLANQTMSTTCFRDYVLAASWTETNGLTQPQIWDKLCSGTVTIAVDMYLGSWYENHVSKTIGYENEPDTVHMNRYFVDTAYMVADNLIHEAEGHSQGFRHDGVKATSVPYGLNAAFEACAPAGP